MKIHYAGEIRDHIGLVLPGWAACCSGERAMKIRRKVQHTYLREHVTCKSCLRRLESHDEYLEVNRTNSKRTSK